MKNFDEKIKNKVLSVEYTKAPVESEMTKMFDQLDGSLIIKSPLSTERIESKTRILQPFLLRIAAAISILAVVGFSIYHLNEVNIYVSNGNNLTHELPDGSTVELNADSEIRYNKALWLLDRKVSLEGEAYFEVQKGKKFTVTSDFGNVQVLGTSFNVYSRGQNYEVECVTGRVKVRYVNNKKHTILSKGEAIAFDGIQDGRFYKFDAETRTDWRGGEFFFDNESIQNVLDEFSRQFDVNVIIDKENSLLKYTGYFNNSDLELALKMICDPLELKYQINNDQIEITNN